MPAPRRALALLCLLPALAAAGCGGGGDDDDGNRPKVGVKGDEAEAAGDLGFPAFATKNTTRVGGADSVANAAAVARAVYPGVEPASRPKAVALVGSEDWRAGVAAAALAAEPVGAPILLSEGRDLPAATREALDALSPTGSREVGRAQVIRVGDVAEPDNVKTTDIEGRTTAELAAAIDAVLAQARGRTSDHVVVVGSEKPEYAIPAAGWAAKSGDPVLFVDRDRVPAATKAAIQRHQQPKIYVLGPKSVVSDKAMRELRRLGTAERIEAGDDPVANAIAFSRFRDGSFGWGVSNPGHGLIFVNAKRPLDAVAATPLSSNGSYAPILLHTGGPRVDRALEGALLDIKPGYDKDPVTGVYNHGWIIGDTGAMTIANQARIDSHLESAPVETEQRRQNSS